MWFSSDCLDHEGRTTTMADKVSMALAELVRKAEAERGRGLSAGGGAGAEPGADGGGGEPAPGRRAARADGGAERAAQRVPRAGVGHAGRARSSCRCRGCATAATSRACWSRASEPSGRWWRWCARRTSTGCRRGGWTSWSRRWGWTGSRRARSVGCARRWTRRSSGSGSGHSKAPTRMSGWTPPS